MRIAVVSLLLSAQAKKDMQFYCEVCSALVEESHWKVSNVGRLSVFLKLSIKNLH